MTYKHGKFDDSQTMRSFERVAREKGLVKTDPIIKSASNDLKPTANLTENILKLCEGLRRSGLEKYASDLEDKFVVFKQAATLYDTHGETGEDVVNSAHRDGSHKMEGLDNAIFKTILDKHLETIKVINKVPTGKLSNANDILNAVKIVLGSSFLESGRANITRKTAQEVAATTPASAEPGVGGVAKDVAISAGSVYLMNRAYNIVKNWRAGAPVRAYEVQLVQLAKQQATTDKARIVLETALKGPDAARVAAKITPEVAAALEKKVMTNVADAVAKSTTSSVGKAVAPELGKAGLGAAERAAAQTAGKSALVEGAGVVAKSSGAWGRLTSLLGRAGAAAGEAGATEIGGGALGAGASVAAAALVGAIGGYLIGNALFDKYQEPTEIKDAGDLLVESADNLSDELPTNAKKAIIDFKSSYNRVLANYSILKDLKESKSISDISKLKALSDALWESNKHAQTIWGFAQAALDEKWYNPRGMFGGSISGLVTKSHNYMIRSNDLNELINKFISDVTIKVEEKLKQPQVSPTGSIVSTPETQKILQGFIDALNGIEARKREVNDLELPNKAALNKFLDDAKAFGTIYKDRYSAAQDKSSKKYLDFFNMKLNKLNKNIQTYDNHLASKAK